MSSGTTTRPMARPVGVSVLATACFAGMGLFAGCGSTGGERRQEADDNTHDALVDSLVAEAESLVSQAEANADPAASLAPLDSARTLLYRAMSFSAASRAAADLADGAGALTSAEIDRALRRARMDICRAAPDYRCLIDNAVEAARATVPEGRDLAFRTIALARARLGDVDGAIETAAHIPGFDPTKSRTRGGGLRARADGSDSPYVYYPLFDDPRVVIVAMTARTGDADTALERAERLGVVTRVWREVAAAYVSRGDTLQALDVIARAVQLADGVEDDEERARVLVHAGLAWGRLGRSDLAAESLTRALADAELVKPAPSRISLLVDLATASMEVSTAHAERAVAKALALLDATELRYWEQARLRNRLDAVLGTDADDPPVRPSSFLTSQDAIAAARTGDIDPALALARSDRFRNRRGREQVELLTEVAAARIRAGDVRTARRDLDRVKADIAANRDLLARGVDHSWHYHTAGTLADVAAVLAQAGDSAGARDMYLEAIAEAARAYRWDVYPFRPASPDDPNPFDTFGSGVPEVPTDSNPLAENYMYIRALALHGAACAAAKAGFPVDPASLREAAVPATQPGHEREYGVRPWVVGAVALALAERGCTSEDGAIPPRDWTIR